ncbi:nicotinate (nicotinamide) nucleotide adenylyltransferase [Thermodesulfobium sp. 4217-1]|uniref:nicotinate (nicotinamide) nucleotide adenylyltransferase n=1 Tax=Thermodesulfobium sp. 4217-1 TaxID=3120013 RepID=UPI003221B11D
MVKFEHKIAILGGTFDPVHIGHLKLAQASLNLLDPDLFLWIPAKRSPLKSNLYASDYHRWCMLYECTKDEKRFTLSDLEIAGEEPSYTFLTLIKIRDMYPDSNLYFVMGLDTALSLPSWYRINDILEICKFAVFERNTDIGDSIESLPREILENIEFFKVDIPDTSSNLIRRKISSNEDLSELLDPSTIEYISRFNLYK